MSPGHEEADEPVTEGEPVAHEGPFEPSPHVTVVISGDGSAAVDGEPVPVAQGATVDAAILDLLHARASERGTAVTAAISDPAAGYVAHVEVFPDGSSSLREQRSETVEPSLAEEGAEAEADGTDPAPAAGTGGGPVDVDEAAYALPEPEGTPAARPVPPPAPARRPGSRQSDDEFEGPGLLGRPLVIGPVALGVAALVVVPLVILGSGGSGDGGDREETAARAGGSPSAGTSPPLRPSSLPIPPPSASASASASASDKGKDGSKDGSKKKPKATGTSGSKGAGRVTVTVTARPPAATTTVTAKPPQDTAASAVKRLAASDPSGRHICYRAYVSGQGWQKPVCDGTIAGSSGQNRPIKALNIAVHGVGGSAANAFRHVAKPVDGHGKWQPSWTAVTGDGENFTIGSAKRNAPNMLGFAMNVGSGEICNTVRLRGRDWGGRVCSKPRPDFTFGGTLDNDVWLEAVKLTV
ncbi:hypothetical protein [Streptomyces hawaiiensis]|uniref:Hydrogenase expression protein HypA n=1 Tax=Streptomyces hawaiiensis TaxID=67305 RepID=A0A6G5RMM0_9ACTN|nr:hypothetical protein [Streptomyces hawaiiensis]QCD59081.1 hypothetical protein CEB94_32795 [Streptomyces hawaiiensis]